MGLFTRKSRWEQALDVGVAMAGLLATRRAMKVGAGVAAGALGLTAASAAVSAARDREDA